MSTIKLNASSDIPKFIAASAVERHRMQNRTLYQLISKLSAEKVDYRFFFFTGDYQSHHLTLDVASWIGGNGTLDRGLYLGYFVSDYLLIRIAGR